jgi:hypothetical protein
MHPPSAFTFRALDDRGEEILDELERRTDRASERFEHGQREYHLDNAGPDGFDTVLNKHWPDRPEHVAKVPTGS